MIDEHFIKTYTPFVEKRLAAMKVVQYYGDRTTISDLVQEIFTKALLRQDKYDPDKGAITTWLSLLVNDAVSELKRKTKDAMTHIEKSLDSTTDWNGTGDEEYLTGHDVLAQEDRLWADQMRFYSENMDMVDAALGGLTSRMQFVVKSRLIDGMTHKEIASVMNISEENSRVMYLRGLQDLREAAASGG